jgi:hypothetical protein
MTGAVLGAVDAGAKVVADADDDNKTKSAGSKSNKKKKTGK